MTLLIICMVIIAISLLAVGGYLIYDFIKDADKKRINKILMDSESEKEYYNLICDVQYLKEEVEKLKKKRGK